MSDEVRVAIVEDQPGTRAGLAALLSGTPGFRAVAAFGSMEQALEQIESEPDLPHVVLLDIQLPGMSGIEGVRRLKTRHPSLPILMLTVFGDDDHVFEAICAGASGYLLKDTPPKRLLQSIRELHEGGAPMSPEIARKIVTTFQKTATPKQVGGLSPRETQVLQLMADGHSYKTCAREIGLSVDTIRFHVRSIYEKLHVHSKSEAVVKALRGGLLS